MRTKNVYVYTDNSKNDFYFRQADIKTRGIDQRDVFTAVDLKHVEESDLGVGLHGWDRVRVVDANGYEKIYD
jgi:hypothetical protein